MRPVWRTELGDEWAQISIKDGEVVLSWPSAEVRAETMEELLTLAAAAPLSPALYSALMNDMDLLAGGPARPWTP